MAAVPASRDVKVANAAVVRSVTASVTGGAGKDARLITYLCPMGPEHPSGGLRKLYDQVEILRAAGFAAQAIDVRHQVIDAFPGDLLVVPEIFGDHLRTWCPGVARISLNQNAHFSWNNVADLKRHPYLSTPELRAVLCVSEHNRQLLRHAFPSLEVPILVFPTSVEGRPGGDLDFHAEPTRSRTICFFGRKNANRAVVVIGMLAARGVLEGWDVRQLDGTSDAELCATLASASVFLSFSELEGLGSPPLEAMASGALVVGFSAFGGRDYLDETTGFPVPEDDLLTFARRVEALLADLNADPAAHDDRRRAALARVRERYGRQAEKAGIVKIFERLAPEQKAAVVAASRPRAEAPADRPAASLVVLAWNAWEHTRACLESLLPTLSPADEVIVVDNGSTDGTAAGLAQFPSVRVVTNAENHGFPRGCNDGAAIARNEVLVFLNNDTVVCDGWLDALLAPFSDPVVGATGPRSNGVSGHQLLRAEYTTAPSPEFVAFVKRWAERARGTVSETMRLVGFCLAVRQSAFDEVDGFDEGYGIGGFEDDDLCRKLSAMGWTLLIAHDSYVHHDGHVTFEANGLDWLALQGQNQLRFVDKWTLGKAAGEAVSHHPPATAATSGRAVEPAG